MPSYTAPVKDMMFLFEKLRDNKNYNELEKYNEVSADLVKDILEEAAKINQNLTHMLLNPLFPFCSLWILLKFHFFDQHYHLHLQ